MNKKYPSDYFEDDLNPAKSNRKSTDAEPDGQLAFFKPYNHQENANEADTVKTNTRAYSFGQQANRLNQNKYTRNQHSFSPIEAISIDDMYIFEAQIDVVSKDMTLLVQDMPVKFDNFVLNLSKYSEEETTDQEVFAESIKDLKQMCDQATLREKDLYEILDRLDNQGLRFKSVGIEQLTQLLEDTKVNLSKMPPMSVISENPLLTSEYEQLETRIHALKKEILRRTIYEKANTTHHLIRPLRSLKSAIYYINRFIGYDEPRKYLLKSVKVLVRLRELANFVVNPEHNLSEEQVAKIIEVIKQGSYEWDNEFLDNGSSVWDFGPFDIKKIPLTVLASNQENYVAEQEISLSVIPDYLIHQVRILLNNIGLRKRPPFFQPNHKQNKFDE